MTNKKTYYITTPIYYPSDKLHMGHAYSTTAADTIARYKRKMGYDVYFLTGTDEHGQKIERKAQEKGVSPKQYVDEIVESIKSLWSLMDIKYDGYIRTTDEKHIQAVQKIFTKLFEQGDIYKSVYSGKYCTSCETHFLERQLIDGKCPDCNGEVELIEEESYFLRLSKYAPRLIEHIKANSDFIQPASRANEMLQNFLLPGLEDVAVSRTGMKWGIPVPFDEKHVVYVWIDALSNYISALGYMNQDGNDELFNKYWPADVHLIGKEILRFHTIIWPIILMALDLPLPKQIFGHGWLVLSGGKMSKSKGNVVDPVLLIQKYGVDAIRYFLMREVAFGQDGLFSTESLLLRINADLANDLGNLLSRTVAMIEKYFDSKLPQTKLEKPEEDTELVESAKNLSSQICSLINNFKINNALEAIWKHIGLCNKYIDVTMPWLLSKSKENDPRLANVLYNLAESLRIVALLIEPVMPNTSPKIFEQLGIKKDSLLDFNSHFGEANPIDFDVAKGNSLFPRLDVAKELESLDALLPKVKDYTTALEKPVKQANEQIATEQTILSDITIDEFNKMDLRLALVERCEAIEGADKLYKLTIKIGNETRTICSGVKQFYSPTELVGKTVVVILNLKPRKIRGILSHGMILCASGADSLSVLTTLNENFAHGSKIN